MCEAEMRVGSLRHPYNYIEPTEIEGSQAIELIRKAPDYIASYSLEANSLCRFHHVVNVLRLLDEDPSRISLADLLMPEVVDLTARVILARNNIQHKDRVYFGFKGIDDTLQVNIPSISRSSIVGLEVGVNSGDFIYSQTSSDFRIRAGLVVDGVTDPAAPGLDKALAVELQRIFPTILKETDETLTSTHRWSYINSGDHRTNTMNNVLEIHRRLLEARNGKDKPYYKGTGVYWVDGSDELMLNYWGDVKIAIVAREKRVGKPKIIFTNGANASYDATTTTLTAIASSPFIGLNDRVEAQRLAEQHITNSYAVKYNDWNPNISVGVVGYPGDFSINVGAVRIERTDEFDMLPIVYTDGFETLAKVLGIHPVNLALYLNDHSSRAVNNSQWNSPLVDILLSPAISIFHGEGFPVGTEIRTYTDDASLQVIDSPYNHGKMWWNEPDNQLEDTLDRIRKNEFLLRGGEKIKDFIMSIILKH